MNRLLIFLFIIFIIMGIILILQMYIPIIKNIRNRKNNSAIEQDPETILAGFSSERDAGKISKGFVLLLKQLYVLIHTMVNEGNMYNDEVQSSLFCESLTEGVLENLNSLEGKYE